MSIPKEPRQMMINMMYLVLTALLALNVSAEILNAFHVVNDGINNSNVAFDAKNQRTLAAFAKQMTVDPKKTEQFNDSALAVQASSDALCKYIQYLKDTIINGSGGWLDKTKGDAKTMAHNWDESKGSLFDDKNLDVSTRLMVDQKRANDLRKKINALRKRMLNVVNSVDPNAIGEFNAQLPLRVDSPKENDEHEIKPWERYNFEMVPTIAAVTILNKFQNDARTSESQLLDFLYKQINSQDVPVDRIVAKVVAPTSYVMDGQQYKADIFVAAYSSTQENTVLLGHLDPNIAKKDADGNYVECTTNPISGSSTSVPVEAGMAHYATTAAGTGDIPYSGVVAVRGAGGTVKYYPFDATYTAAQAAVVVSPDKMNVFYIGVDNPVSLSVPGFGNDKVSANMNNGSSITGGKGKYVVRVTPDGLGAKGTDVIVSATQLDKTNKVMGSVHFRVKRIPDPNAQVGNLFPGPISSSTFKAQQVVLATLANFDFDVKFPVISFDMTYAAKRQDLVSDSQTGGSTFTAKMMSFMKLAKPGDVFYLDNIKCKAPDGTVRKLPSITYKMI